MGLRPVPNLSVPVLNASGMMDQTWFEYFQSLQATTSSLNNTTSGLPASILASVAALYSPILRSINPQTGTTYTLVLADNGKYLTFTNAAAITATVPPNSTVALAVGSQIDWKQGGAGKLTWAQGAGVTINSLAGYKSAAGQHAGGTLIKVATNEWDLVGSLIA